MPSTVTHLESALDGTRYEAGVLQTMHQDRPLWVRYDLDQAAALMSKERLAARAPGMWRYRELLPHTDEQTLVTLGEGPSPLLPAPRLGARLGLSRLLIKDESQLPTGSFKSRGMAMALTMAAGFDVTTIALPSAGNAGGAAAAYGARAGLNVYVFMPADTPRINQLECLAAGAHTYVANGLINDCGALVKAGKSALGWFDLSTLKEPYRLEGKKTMGLELAEQCNWVLPDVIVYPTGGGTGLIAMWKAFQELKAMGWLESANMPRMVAVQADGCCPIVTAYEAGERFAAQHENAHTIASGIRVPAAVGDFMILDTVRESNGCAIAVAEDSIQRWMRDAIAAEGISICPETSACISALDALTQSGWIQPDERVVVLNTGAAQKYVEALAGDLPSIDLAAVDWEVLAAATG